jgi:hypothetical protein
MNAALQRNRFWAQIANALIEEPISSGMSASQLECEAEGQSIVRGAMRVSRPQSDDLLGTIWLNDMRFRLS